MMTQLRFSDLIEQDSKKRFRLKREQRHIDLQQHLPPSCRLRYQGQHAGWELYRGIPGHRKHFGAINFAHPIHTGSSLDLAHIVDTVIHASCFYEILPLAELNHWFSQRPHYFTTLPKDVWVNVNGVNTPPSKLPARFYFT